MDKELHVSDQDMLLAADGELSMHRAEHVREHLAECWSCRARMADIEGTITDFTRAYRHTFDPQLPPITGARVLLQAQLAKLADDPTVRPWHWLFHFASLKRAAYVGIALAVAAMACRVFLEHAKPSGATSGALSIERGAEPNRNLTPGAIRTVAIAEVCAMPHEEVVAEVSTSLRREVFRDYGIQSTHPDDYEVDYLIAPGLGGAEDINNLWPEPNTSQMWNAHVKDTLEERLHEMVCGGVLDLSTAQHDIATDWIAAYKKYFHTDQPLTLHSRLESEMSAGGPHKAIFVVWDSKFGRRAYDE
jgi:hypothetical protein